MNMKLPSVLQRMRYVVDCAVNDWFKHRDASKGVALAFYTLFSMAPILVLVIAVAGTFFGKQGVQTEILSQLHQLLGTQGAEAVQLILTGTSDQVQGLRATALATILLLLGAISVFAELKTSLDEIWMLPTVVEISLWDLLRTRLLSFGLVLVLAVLMMVSLVLSAALERYCRGIWKDEAPFFSALAGCIGFSVIATLFAVSYKMLPRIRLSWHDVLIDSLGASGLLTLGKMSIGNGSVANSFGVEFTRHYALYFGSLKNATLPEKVLSETQAVVT